MRPRGTPPTPRAMSSEMEPVEMTWMSRMSGSSLPSRMMEPLPNWRSTAPIASSIAFSFSGFTAMGCLPSLWMGTERCFSIPQSDLLVDSPDTSLLEEVGREQARHPGEQGPDPVAEAERAADDPEGERRPPRPAAQSRTHRRADGHCPQRQHQEEPEPRRRVGHPPERQAHRDGHDQ